MTILNEDADRRCEDRTGECLFCQARFVGEATYVTINDVCGIGGCTSKVTLCPYHRLVDPTFVRKCLEDHYA